MHIYATHNSDNLKWNQQILDHLCTDSCVLQWWVFALLIHISHRKRQNMKVLSNQSKLEKNQWSKTWKLWNTMLTLELRCALIVSSLKQTILGHNLHLNTDLHFKTQSTKSAWMELFKFNVLFSAFGAPSSVSRALAFLTSWASTFWPSLSIFSSSLVGKPNNRLRQLLC